VLLVMYHDGVRGAFGRATMEVDETGVDDPRDGAVVVLPLMTLSGGEEERPPRVGPRRDYNPPFQIVSRKFDERLSPQAVARLHLTCRSSACDNRSN